LVEAAEKELTEDNATLKKFYADKVRDLRPQVAVLERRVDWMERAQARRVDVDTRQVATAIRAALRTKVKSELRRIFLGWIESYRYADQEAEFTVRVPLAGVSSGDSSGDRGGNCKQQVGHIGARDQQD
jgi:hypothetical protein